MIRRVHPRAGTTVPVVVCITDIAEERARLAASFDGVGVLVLAPNTATAQSFLGSVGDQPGTEPIGLGPLTIDPSRHTASWAGESLRLTAHELTVLDCLARRPGRVWTHRQLHELAWDGTYFTGPGAVQSVIKRLRAKLRNVGAPLVIDAVRGVGFRIAAGDREPT